MPFHIVIPSKNSENLLRCVDAIRKNEPGFVDRIIVVDDGLSSIPEGVRVVKGEKPFIFARNANLGIKAANSDVILLNDDALLQTPGGFTELTKQQGLVAAAVNGVVGNKNQIPQDKGLRPEPNMLCFVCVFIPKAVQDKIGLLDERFNGYGFEDNDYCTRAKAAGIPMSVFDGCVVEHKSLTPTFRSDPNWVTEMMKAREIYHAKYA